MKSCYQLIWRPIPWFFHKIPQTSSNAPRWYFEFPFCPSALKYIQNHHPTKAVLRSPQVAKHMAWSKIGSALEKPKHQRTSMPHHPIRWGSAHRILSLMVKSLGFDDLKLSISCHQSKDFPQSQCSLLIFSVESWSSYSNHIHKWHTTIMSCQAAFEGFSSQTKVWAKLAPPIKNAAGECSATGFKLRPWQISSHVDSLFQQFPVLLYMLLLNFQDIPTCSTLLPASPGPNPLDHFFLASTERALWSHNLGSEPDSFSGVVVYPTRKSDTRIDFQLSNFHNYTSSVLNFPT